MESTVMPTTIRRCGSLAVMLLTALFCLAFATANANASATMNVATDTSVAAAETSLTLNTALSGSGYDVRQYGAQIDLPENIWINYAGMGNSSQKCSGASFSSVSTGYTPSATAFSNSSCPSAARVGTATLGSTSGGIYVVNTSPLPTFGVYFDTNIGTPYGRKIAISYPSGAGARLSIYGLADATTTGLTLDFYNASRPSLSPRTFIFSEPGMTECTAESEVTGNAYTYPSSGTGSTETAATPADVTITGCNVTADIVTDSDLADTETSLTLNTNITGSDDDSHQYAAKFVLPPNLVPETGNFGTNNQMCPGGSISLSGGLKIFSITNCPSTAKVGTATLGAASGDVYLINSSPFPTFGVYFSSGVTPYGRAYTWTFDTNGQSTLELKGLVDDSTDGLKVTFYNGSRASSLPAKVWRNVYAEEYTCNETDGYAEISTLPAPGGVYTKTSHLPIWHSISDCA